MGRQFLISLVFPFLGIILMQAVLKVGVSLPLRKHARAYPRRGVLQKDQILVINLLLNPSIPLADFLLESFKDKSSSANVSSLSSLVCSPRYSISCSVPWGY